MRSPAAEPVAEGSRLTALATLVARLGRRHAVELVTYGVVMVVVTSAALYMQQASPPFNTPDETARYRTAVRFAETGSVWERDILTEYDPEGLVHFRAEVNYDGGVTTAYAIADPVLSGLVIRAFGRDGGLVALAFVAGLAAVGLAAAVHRATRSGLTVLLALPLTWMLAHVFAGMLWYLFFAGWGLFFLVGASQRKSRRLLAVGTLGVSIALLSRYQDAPMVGVVLAGFAVQFAHRDGLRLRELRNASLIVGSGLTAAFVLPQLAINQAMFDSPLRFGQSLLLTDVIYLDREPLAGLGMVVTALFPTWPSMEVIVASGWYLLVALTPALAALTLLFLLHLATVREHRFQAVSRWALAIWVVGIIYTVLARANPENYHAIPTAPDLSSSVARYWYPLYLGAAIAGGVALRRYLPSTQWRTALLLVLALTSTVFVWRGAEQDLTDRRASIERSVTGIRGMIDRLIEPEAVVYAGILDKWLLGERRVASWWESVELSSFEATTIASSMARTYEAGFPVYALLWAGHPDQGAALAAAFAGSPYQLERQIGPDGSSILLRLSERRLSNGGFEQGSTGWSVAIVRGDGELARSSARSKFGFASGRLYGTGDTLAARVPAFSFAPSTRYTVSVWVYIETIGGAESLLLSAFDGVRPHTTEVDTSKVGEWQYVSLSFVSDDSAGTGHIDFLRAVGTTARLEAFVDGAQIDVQPPLAVRSGN